MTSIAEDLVAKFRAAAEFMEKLPMQLLTQKPSAHFAENYNSARAVALSKYPDIGGVAPPEIAIVQDPSGAIPKATFIEIISYSTELANILKPRADAERLRRATENIQRLNSPRRW